MTTPAEKAGLKVGDKIRTLVETHCIRKGTVITLDSDDGSNMPYFTHDNGDSSPFTVTRQWERVMTKPTNKQEALDQIDSLRAYIEDCDKPKRVRVYVKEDALETDSRYGSPDESGGNMQGMVGGVFTMRDGFTNIPDEEFIQLFCEGDAGQYWAFRKDQCIIVEGKLPSNDTKEP